MPLIRVIHIVAALLIASGLAACGITSPSDLITEPPFTGTISPAQSALPTITFSTRKTGEFIIKVNSVSPDSGATIGVQYGQPSAGLCGVAQQNPRAGQGRTAFDVQAPQGEYCVQVFDSGFLNGKTESFNITVSHS